MYIRMQYGSRMYIYFPLYVIMHKLYRPVHTTMDLSVSETDFFFMYRTLMNMIMSNGHSRIPVYSGSHTNIIGLILVCIQSVDNWAQNQHRRTSLSSEHLLFPLKFQPEISLKKLRLYLFSFSLTSEVNFAPMEIHFLHIGSL